jgi:hypothetical protein
MEAVILHTMSGDKIDNVFGVFTDEEKFVDWAEEYVREHPGIDLYYTLLPLNPNPGEGLYAKTFRVDFGGDRSISAAAERLWAAITGQTLASNQSKY